MVQLYKNQREKKSKLTEENDRIQQEIKDIQKKISGANDLFLIKNRLNLELNKFGEIGKDSNLNNKIQDLKNNRIKGIVGFMRNVKASAMNMVSKPFESVERSFLVGKLLIVLMFLTLMATAFFYSISLNHWIILLGFVTFILIFFFFLIINILGADLFANQLNIKSTIDISSNLNEYEKFMAMLNKKEDEFFVNAAWVKALNVEMNKIEKTIFERLRGHSIEDLNKKISEYQVKIKQNNEELNKILDKMISAEDYLKIRREMDIIKIELEGKDSAVLNQWLLSNEILIEGFSTLNDKIKEGIMELTEFIRQKINLNITFIS
jgi:ABC-type multidrug transport system fused ATPase/permease subunit